MSIKIGDFVKGKDGYKARMSQNLSKNMSRYFSENPAEYERL